MLGWACSGLACDSVHMIMPNYFILLQVLLWLPSTWRVGGVCQWALPLPGDLGWVLALTCWVSSSPLPPSTASCEQLKRGSSRSPPLPQSRQVDRWGRRVQYLAYFFLSSVLFFVSMCTPTCGGTILTMVGTILTLLCACGLFCL